MTAVTSGFLISPKIRKSLSLVSSNSEMLYVSVFHLFVYAIDTSVSKRSFSMHLQRLCLSFPPLVHAHGFTLQN